MNGIGVLPQISSSARDVPARHRDARLWATEVSSEALSEAGDAEGGRFDAEITERASTSLPVSISRIRSGVSPEVQAASVSPRIDRPSQFLGRPGIIPTNMGLTGTVRNTAIQGDGLGRLIGRLVPRRFFAETAGVLAGLTVVAGLYSVFVAMAAFNARRIPQSRIKACAALKDDLTKQTQCAPGVKAAIGNAGEVIDKTITENVRQKREAFGLWLTAAGAFASLVTRLASGSAVAAAPALSVGLVSPGLCAFGAIQAVNDIQKLRAVNKVNRAITHNKLLAPTKASPNEKVQRFTEDYKRFHKRSANLLKWASANSVLIAVTGALAPILSAFTLGLAAPILGTVLGVATFLRFALFEPRMEKLGFKPITVSWADPYRAKDIEARAELHDLLESVHQTTGNTKKQIISGLGIHQKVAIKLADILGFFPFLARMPNAVYRKIAAHHLKSCTDPARNAQYAKLQLETVRDLTLKYQKLLEIKKAAITDDMDHIRHVNSDPYEQKISLLKSELGETEKAQSHLLEINERAINLQRSLPRYQAESSLSIRMDAVQVDLAQIQKAFVAHFETTTESSVEKPNKGPKLPDAQSFLQTLHRLSKTSSALVHNLYHFQAQSDL